MFVEIGKPDKRWWKQLGWQIIPKNRVALPHTWLCNYQDILSCIGSLSQYFSPLSGRRTADKKSEYQTICGSMVRNRTSPGLLGVLLLCRCWQRSRSIPGEPWNGRAAGPCCTGPPSTARRTEWSEFQHRNRHAFGMIFWPIRSLASWKLFQLVEKQEDVLSRDHILSSLGSLSHVMQDLCLYLLNQQANPSEKDDEAEWSTLLWNAPRFDWDINWNMIWTTTQIIDNSMI